MVLEKASRKRGRDAPHGTTAEPTNTRSSVGLYANQPTDKIEKGPKKHKTNDSTTKPTDKIEKEPQEEDGPEGMEIEVPHCDEAKNTKKKRKQPEESRSSEKGRKVLKSAKNQDVKTKKESRPEKNKKSETETARSRKAESMEDFRVPSYKIDPVRTHPAYEWYGAFSSSYLIDNLKDVR